MLLHAGFLSITTSMRAVGSTVDVSSTRYSVSDGLPDDGDTSCAIRGDGSGPAGDVSQPFECSNVSPCSPLGSNGSVGGVASISWTRPAATMMRNAITSTMM